MAINKIEIQDEKGEVYYPHTDSSVVFNRNGETLESDLVDINSKLTNTQVEDLLIKSKILGAKLGEDEYTVKPLYDVSINKFGTYWMNNGVLTNNPDVRNRVNTPIIHMTEGVEVDFRFPSDFMWCSIKCSDDKGNNAADEKKYLDGNKYYLPPGYRVFQFKHVTDRDFTESEKNTLCLSVFEQVYSNSVNTMINKIDSNTSGYDFIFPFMTDIHHFPTTDLKWGGNIKNYNIRHLKGLVELTNKFLVDCTVIGGDLSYDWTTMDLFKGFIKDVGKESQKANSPVYFMAGNHDFGDSYNFGKTGANAVLSPAQLNNLLGRAANKNMYYTKDFPQEKIRMIFLNTDDNYILLSDGTTKYPRVPNGNDDETIHVVGNEQGKWLSKALRTPGDGWTIMLFSHVPLRSQTKNSQAIADLINARKSKASKTFTKTNSNTDFSWEFSVDYSKEYDVDIVGWVSGHTHSDTINEFNGIKVITTTLAMGDSTGNGKDDIDTSKTTFDVFCLDKTNRKLDIKRFGSIGSDRSITY
nr:MAG TPA: metallophosphatase domain protein [Caudoviricetes sp.]